MRNMYALHEEVAVSNACLTVSEGCAVDNNILAEDVLITDYETCVVALIVEVTLFPRPRRVPFIMLT